jgi:hypothetical protein
MFTPSAIAEIRPSCPLAFQAIGAGAAELEVAEDDRSSARHRRRQVAVDVDGLAEQARRVELQATSAPPPSVGEASEASAAISQLEVAP